MSAGNALILDAHLPSMTARFRIPAGLPFSAGLYHLEFLRTPTKDDEAAWSHLPEPPDDLAVLEALEGMVSAFAHAAGSQYQLGALDAARAAVAQAAGAA